ncbi:MAG TPA: hypothetical protein VKS98_11640 [Chthoniobacterales bacterium]|nr:hypothetical protein [Chthoniobacterales bacterium]
MAFETAIARDATSSCNPVTVGLSSPLPTTAVIRSKFFFQPWLVGLLVTLAQLAVAVFLLAPEGSFSFRYSSLVQHDGFWFENIVDRGYQTIVPPIDHKVMEVSNVAFFPAYPALASALCSVFPIESQTALLIVAQLATWGFWTYVFLFAERWKLSANLRFFGALVIAAHPAAFFLIAGYSESLFLMALLGFMYWSSGEGRTAKILAAVHGIAMSAARIVGIPCAAFPVVRDVFKKGWGVLRQPRQWLRNYGSAIGLMIIATLGAISFFIYCQVRWSRWDLYMLTQSAGWNIEPDYFAVFRPSSYRWLLPALNDPTEMSQMSMTVGALMLVAMAIIELLPAVRRNTGLSTRVGIYFCAAIIYYISVSGVASLEMESMLRYEFCVHVLIVLAFLHFLRQFRLPPVPVRALGIAVLVLACAVSLGVQGWYVWNFTRGNWVA